MRRPILRQWIELFVLWGLMVFAGGASPLPSDVVFKIRDDGRVVRSMDGGGTWIGSETGLPHTAAGAAIPVLSIVGQGSGEGHVYALTDTSGIFRWNRFIGTWENASHGLPVPLLHSTEGSLLAVNPSDGDRAYALLNVPVTSHHEQRLLFGTNDGGVHWSVLKNLQDSRIDAMRIAEDGRLILNLHEGNLLTVETNSLSVEDEFSSNILSLNRESSSVNSLTETDLNNVAVIEDDGSIIGREFDLANRSVEFRPVLTSYDVAGIESTFDEDVGDLIQLGDEDSRFLPFSSPFLFYGIQRKTFFISSNGYLTFLQRDIDFSPTVDEFVTRMPRIAPFWADLDPRAGKVYVKMASDRVVVSWIGVPLFSQATILNTFQVALFQNGVIRFNYKDVAGKAAIVGIGNGNQRTSRQLVFSGISILKGTEPIPILQRFRTPDLDMVRLAQRFYQTHDDDFDALIAFGSGQYSTNIASGAGAYYLGVKNDTIGVGLSVVDNTAIVGSSGRLQGLINMNGLSQYPDDISRPIPDTADSAISILGQEWGHRFGAYVRFRDGLATSAALLGRSNSHWNYFLNTEASVLEGNEWRDNGDGSFTATDVVHRYSRLDQYLMGLRTASEVPPLMLITNPQPLFSGTISSFVSTMGLNENGIRDTTKNFGPADKLKGFWLRVAYSGDRTIFSSVFISASGRNDGGVAPETVSSPINNLRQLASSGSGLPYQITHLASSAPHARYFDTETGDFTGDNITIQGTRKEVTIESILDYEGERIPARGDAPTTFRHAFILVVPQGTQPSSLDLARIDAVRTGWEQFYREATDRLANVSTTLLPGVSRLSRSVSPRGMTSVATPGVADASTTAYGALEAGSNQTTGVAFLTGRSGSRIISETGLPALGTVRRAVMYAERVSGINTGIAVASPLGRSTLTLQLRSADGALATETSINLEGGAQLARFLTELFPQYTFPAVFRGSITMNASLPVAVTTLRTAINESGEFLMTTLPVADLSLLNSSISDLAHFADGSGYTTDVILGNPEGAQTTGQVEWRSSNGALVGAAVRYSIPARGVQMISSGSGAGALNTGYVVVRADTGQTGPFVRSTIQLRQNGRLVAMTGVYPSATANRSQSFIDLSSGHDSGIALLNDNSSPAVVQLTAYDQSGSAVLEPRTITLAPRNQSASFVSQLFPLLPNGFRGTLEISSDMPVQGMALRSTATDDRFILAAVPIESLDARRNDASLYFPQIVDGGGYSTEIFIMNLGSTPGVPRLSFYSPRGSAIKLPLIPR